MNNEQVAPSNIAEHVNHMTNVRQMETKKTGVEKPIDIITADQGVQT